MKPEFNKTIDQTMIDAASAAGLPLKNDVQAVACAVKSGVTWYKLADGAEVIETASGKAAAWPE